TSCAAPVVTGASLRASSSAVIPGLSRSRGLKCYAVTNPSRRGGAMSSLAGRLVGGIDSSTQSCKAVVRDAHTGRLVRSGQARHPAGSDVDLEAWLVALQETISKAGDLADVHTYC